MSEDDAESDVNWDVEIKRRLDEVDQGKVRVMPFSEVLAELLKELDDAVKG